MSGPPTQPAPAPTTSAASCHLPKPASRACTHLHALPGPLQHLLGCRPWAPLPCTIVTKPPAYLPWGSEFNDFATRPELDLYPADLMKKIDEASGGQLCTTCPGQIAAMASQLWVAGRHARTAGGSLQQWVDTCGWLLLFSPLAA